MNPIIYFWTIPHSIAKCQCVREIVHEQFSQSRRILIVVPNQQASAFVSRLLRDMPAEQFTPHLTASEPVQAAVVITTTHASNLNKAQTLLNLSAQPCAITHEFAYIHELDDRSDPAKERAAMEKKQAYLKAGLRLEER